MSRAAARTFLAAVLLLLVAGPGCRGRRVKDPGDLLDPSAFAGLYRARLQEPDGASRKFRLLLFASLPDRLHGEVLSPVGTTELVVDAGGGRIAVTPVDEKISYVGESSPEIFEMLFGIPLELDRLVAAILAGEPPGGGLRLDRSPAGAGLPFRVALEAEGRSLALELRRAQPQRAEHVKYAARNW